MSYIQSSIRVNCKLILAAKTLVFLVVFKRRYGLLSDCLHARIGVGDMLGRVDILLLLSRETLKLLEKPL